MSVTDAQGTVIARGHAAKFGDNIATVGCQGHARRSGSSCGYRPHQSLHARASCPIRREGVGGHGFCGRAATTPAWMTSRLAGVDVTIFKGDTRVMTTILRDNKGLSAPNWTPGCVQAVLERGEVSVVRNVISGVRYQSAYWPVRTADGKILGMWFVGNPLNKIWQKIENKPASAAPWVTALGLLTQLVLAVLVGLRVSAPVTKITRYAGRGGRQERRRLCVRSNDDMGQLADALRQMETNLRKLVKEAHAKTQEARSMSEEARQAVEEARRAQKRPKKPGAKALSARLNAWAAW